MQRNTWSARTSRVAIVGILIAGIHGSGAAFPEGLRAERLAVSTGSEAATFAIANDGELYVWGTRPGQTPIEAEEYHLPRPQRVIRPEMVNTWHQVAGGHDHTLAIVNGGQLLVWGSNRHGQLGWPLWFLPSAPPMLVPRPDNVSHWQEAGAGEEFSLALSDDGRLFVWGRNDLGQLGFGHTNEVWIPTPKPSPPGVARWARLWPKSPQHVLAADGELHDWTRPAGLTHIAKPPGLTVWREVAASDSHSLALSGSGEVFAWGNNSDGQLGVPDITSSSVPVRVPLPEGITACRTIVAGRRAVSGAIADDGRLLVWGQARFGYLPGPEIHPDEIAEAPIASPTVVASVASKRDWVSLSAGHGYFVATDQAGEAYTWGEHFNGLYDRASSNTPFGRPANFGRFQSVPSPVAGFGRPYASPADDLAVGLAGVEDGMIVVAGQPLELLVSINDPAGAASLEQLRVTGIDPGAAPALVQRVPTEGVAYPVRRVVTNLPPRAYRADVRAVIWDGQTSGGPWHEVSDPPVGPSATTPVFHVVPNDGFDPTLPVVGVHIAGDRLIEGHAAILEVTFARTGPLEAPLELRLNSAGARLGVDYWLTPSVIRFAAGERVVRATVTARFDLLAEGAESTVLGIAPSPAYQVCALAAVNFQILDNAAPRVVISQPFPEATLLPGEPVEVIASAHDPDGQLRLFILYLDDEPVYAEALSATNRCLLRWPWTPATGTHTLRAEAVDDAGETSFSNEVVVHIRTPPDPAGQVMLSAGAWNAFLRAPDGRWFGWGNNVSNALNLDPSRLQVRTRESLPQPVRPPDDGGQWRQLFGSYGASAGVTATGGLRLFGNLYQMGLNGPLPFDLERDGAVDLPDDIADWSAWRSGFGRNTGLASNHQVYQIVAQPFGLLGLRTNSLPPGASGVLDLDGYIDTDGVVRIPNSSYLSPVNFAGLRGRKVAHTRFDQGLISDVTFILTEDGQLWQHGGDEWFGGTNETAPIDGTSATVRRISNPAGVDGWRDIQPCGSALLAWTLDGRLFGWGNNAHGQLGVGDRDDRTALTPVPFPAGVARWRLVAAGAEFAVALGDNGRVYAWGRNDDGQLGLGHLTGMNHPTPLAWFDGLNALPPQVPPAGTPNLPPFGNLTLSANTNLYLPLPYTLTAEVADPDGQPVRVEFLQDESVLGVVTNLPADGIVRWQGQLQLGGQWVFKARITDDAGASTETTALEFTHRHFLTEPPTLFSIPYRSEAREGTTDPQGYVLYRDSRTNLALTVPLVIGGTATPGEDFAPLPAEITFPPGVSVVTLPVTTFINGDGELRETLTIAPAPSPCAWDPEAGDECYRAIPNSTRNITILPPPRSIVTIEAPVATAFEGGQTNAVLRLRRSVVVDHPLEVTYIAHGTADPGLDVDPLPAVFRFAAGQTEIEIPVRARSDTLVESYEQLNIDLLPGGCAGGETSPGCYELGPANAIVQIGDHPGPPRPVINLYVTDPVAIEGTGNHAVIRITRTGDQLGDVEVRLATAGTASPNLDFPEIYGPFRLRQGQPLFYWLVAPPPDDAAESPETLIVSLLPGSDASPGNAGYLVGNTNEVSVILIDPPPNSHGTLTAILIEGTSSLIVSPFELQVAGDPGIRFELQSSADLVLWRRETEHVNTLGRLRINVGLPDGPARFFRLVPLAP